MIRVAIGGTALLLAFAGNLVDGTGPARLPAVSRLITVLADDAPKAPVAIGSARTVVSAAAGDHSLEHLEHGVGAEF
jgi:hypothetical protein